MNSVMKIMEYYEGRMWNDKTNSRYRLDMFGHEFNKLLIYWHNAVQKYYTLRFDSIG